MLPKPTEDFVLSELFAGDDVPEGSTAIDLVTSSFAELSDREIEEMSLNDLLELLRMSNSIAELQQTVFVIRDRCRKAMGRAEQFCSE